MRKGLRSCRRASTRTRAKPKSPQRGYWETIQHYDVDLNQVKQAIATYLHAAGIQAGYTFFAPNVPSHHRLTLELFYGDGHVEYESPHVHSKAAALRLESLLDKLPEERYEPVREVVLKMLAFSVWRERPEVKRVRATFETVHLPSITEFEHGKTETLEPMFSFDFSLRREEQ